MISTLPAFRMPEHFMQCLAKMPSTVEVLEKWSSQWEHGKMFCQESRVAWKKVDEEDTPVTEEGQQDPCLHGAYIFPGLDR